MTSDQAAALLPLWQVMRSLLDSDTAASAEIDALTNQIAGLMTESQLSAIQAMGLTQQDMMPLMEEIGLDPGFERPEGVETGEGGFQPPAGITPGSGPGGGAGGGPGGGGQGDSAGFTPAEAEAFQATRQPAAGRVLAGESTGPISP